MTNKPTIILSLALSLAACRVNMDESAESAHLTNTYEQDGRCSVLENRRFTSVDQRECGIAPGGVAMCAWSIQFTSLDAEASTFAWHYSDVGDVGRVQCEGDQIRVTAAGGTFDATYDPNTQELSWDGVTYAAQ